jgi:hypothetical protein
MDLTHTIPNSLSLSRGLFIHLLGSLPVPIKVRAHGENQGGNRARLDIIPGGVLGTTSSERLDGTGVNL